MKTALAYYNWARWVAQCPEDGCHDARAVYGPDGTRHTEDVCANGHPFRIEMPPRDREAQIVAVVSERTEDADKSWYPENHPHALLHGYPHGQSITELQRETHRVAAMRTAQRDAERNRLRALLAEHGIHVRPDGTFEGSV